MNYFNRIGGRYAITLRAWLLLMPLSVFGTVSFTPEGPQGLTAFFVGWFVGLLVHLIAGLVLLIARFSYLHDGDRKPRPIAALATLLVAGAVRGFSVAFLFELFGVVAQSDYLERMIAGAVITLILFSTAAILIDSQNAYREAAAKLEAERAEAAVLASEGEQRLIEQRVSLLELVRSTLTESLQAARSSEELHRAVEQVVRPLSHNLATQEKLLEPSVTVTARKVRLLPAIRAGLEQQPFNIVGTLAIALIATSYSRVWAFGWLAIPDLLLLTLTVILGFGLFSRLQVRGWWALLAIQAVGIISATITYLLIGESPIAQAAGVVLLSVNISLPAFGIAFFRGFELLRAERLAELRAASGQVNRQRSLIQSRAWVEQQRLGRFVHSELQGRIRATALRAASESAELTPESLAELEAACLRALDLSVDAPDYRAFMADITELWQGVADINFELTAAAEQALQADPWAASGFIEIAREGIANAVKHGAATEVVITLDLAAEEESALRVAVKDNGSAAADQTAGDTHGIGLSALSEFTLETKLELTPAGATLSALLPTR